MNPGLQEVILVGIPIVVEDPPPPRFFGREFTIAPRAPPVVVVFLGEVLFSFFSFCFSFCFFSFFRMRPAASITRGGDGPGPARIQALGPAARRARGVLLAAAGGEVPGAVVRGRRAGGGAGLGGAEPGASAIGFAHSIGLEAFTC